MTIHIHVLGQNYLSAQEFLKNPQILHGKTEHKRIVFPDIGDKMIEKEQKGRRSFLDGQLL